MQRDWCRGAGVVGGGAGGVGGGALPGAPPHLRIPQLWRAALLHRQRGLDEPQPHEASGGAFRHLGFLPAMMFSMMA